MVTLSYGYLKFQSVISSFCTEQQEWAFFLGKFWFFKNFGGHILFLKLKESGSGSTCFYFISHFHQTIPFLYLLVLKLRAKMILSLSYF
jgi:hypothetical protein